MHTYIHVLLTHPLAHSVTHALQNIHPFALTCLSVKQLSVSKRGQPVPVASQKGSLQLCLQASAKGTSYEACVEATAGPDDGTVLRAPTEKQGLTPLCKDTFLGKVGACPPVLATYNDSCCHVKSLALVKPVSQNIALAIMLVACMDGKTCIMSQIYSGRLTESVKYTVC